MSRETKHTARAAAIAAVLAALGFGGAQAFAAPAAPTMTSTARACVSYTCSTACFQKGYTGWYCWNGVCHCTYDPPPQ